MNFVSQMQSYIMEVQEEFHFFFKKYLKERLLANKKVLYVTEACRVVAGGSGLILP